MVQIIHLCHSSDYEGHHGPDRIVAKILQSGFYWPTLFNDARSFVITCDKCQRTGVIGKPHELPLNSIWDVEIFDV